MKKWKSTRFKLLILCFLIILPLLSAYLLNVNRYREDAFSSNISIKEKELGFLAENIKDFIQLSIAQSDQIVINKLILYSLSVDYKDDPEEFLKYYFSLIEPRFGDIKINKEVDSVIFYSTNKSLLFNNTELAYLNDYPKEHEIYQVLLQDNQKIQFRCTEKGKDFTSITLYRALSFKNKNIGMLAIKYHAKALNKYVSDNLEGVETILILPDGSTAVLGGSRLYDFDDNGKLPEQIMEITSNIHNPTSTGEWKIKKWIPRSDINRLSDSFMTYSFSIIIIVLICIIFPGYFIINKLGKRIQKLALLMREVENGNLGIEVVEEGEDEIGYLFFCFRNMTIKLKKLINEVYVMEMGKLELEVRQKKAEMSALQSRINPHFLFNTLEAVMWGIEEENPKTIQVVNAFAGNLHWLVKNNDECVTLLEELHFTEEYLEIYKFRFPKKFDWEAEISEDLKDCLVPKLILQPLVENAIHHGVSKTGTGGFIWISIVKDNGIKITIEDNCGGISEEKLREIEGILQENNLDRDEHIGIQNVYKRLRLFYNCDINFYIGNGGKGTVVSFEIPELRRTENAEDFDS